MLWLVELPFLIFFWELVIKDFGALLLRLVYGLQLWPILQDLSQLKEHYKESWETFLGNAGIRQFFAPREMTTAEYVSKLCGDATIMTTSESKGKSVNSGRSGFDGTTGSNEGTSTSPVQRKLFLPEEVCQLPDDQFLMFADKGSKAVIRGHRLSYLKIPEFNNPRQIYGDDPYHRTKNDLAASDSPPGTGNGAAQT